MCPSSYILPLPVIQGQQSKCKWHKKWHLVYTISLSKECVCRALNLPTFTTSYNRHRLG